jgi:hypothetical protein
VGAVEGPRTELTHIIPKFLGDIRRYTFRDRCWFPPVAELIEIFFSHAPAHALTEFDDVRPREVTNFTTDAKHLLLINWYS